MIRNYTGNKDGLGTGERKGLTVFIKELCKRYPALWNNGSFVNRSMRGSSAMSVHATGRAVDLSFRFVPNHKDASNTKGIKEGGRKQAMEAMDFVVKHADAFGLECILDYFPIPHGRGWRCDRSSWKVYTKSEIHGSPMGDWVHFELSPKMADDADGMRQAFANIPSIVVA
jgi:hypothetical protein